MQDLHLILKSLGLIMQTLSGKQTNNFTTLIFNRKIILKTKGVAGGEAQRSSPLPNRNVASHS